METFYQSDLLRPRFLHLGWIQQTNCLSFTLQIMTHGPHFVFSIASLDSFEQKMAAAQADLNLPSSDFIPIRYRTKNELL